MTSEEFEKLLADYRDAIEYYCYCDSDELELAMDNARQKVLTAFTEGMRGQR